MDRLTKRISGYAHGAEGVSADRLTGSYCRGEFEATACVDKLAEYEDLEEQGKLLKLPCAVGDMVYVLRLDNTAYMMNNEKVWEIVEDKFEIFHFDSIGKTVFLTREEAEAALKKMS